VGKRIVLTFQAIEDLREIHRYVADRNANAAHRLRRRLLTEVKLMATFARAGRVVPEFLDPTLRELVRSPYRIIYRIHENRPSIEILRSWHAARGTPHLL
jgi:plasmid stabilization system protein ParE